MKFRDRKQKGACRGRGGQGRGGPGKSVFKGGRVSVGKMRKLWRWIVGMVVQ